VGYLPEWSWWQVIAAEGFGTFLILFIGLVFTFGPVLGCLHAMSVPRERWSDASGGRGAWIALLLFGLALTALSLVPFIVYYFVIARHVDPPFTPIFKAFALRVLIGAAIFALPAMIWLARRPDVFTLYFISLSLLVGTIAAVGVALERRPKRARDTRLGPALWLLYLALVVAITDRNLIIAACELVTSPEAWCEGGARARTRSMVPAFLTAAALTISLVALRRKKDGDATRLSSEP
jgi:hypothetical protein